MPVMTELGNGALLNAVQKICNNPLATINNIEAGAQLGIGPHLPKIDGSTPLVFAPVIPIITHIPTMMRNVDNSISVGKYGSMAGVLKALIERHAKTITGIDFGYEMEEASGYILADGQEVKVPTKNKRSAISPNMTFPEIQGNLVWNFFRTWMNMISHPDTHHSNMSPFTGLENLDPFVFSYFCMDLMIIQFDPTFLPQNIIDAAFVTCMYPKVTGNLGIKREVGTSDIQERSIDFNGIIQHNSSTFKAGRSIAEILMLHRSAFDCATPVADTIAADATSLGISREIEEIMADFRCDVNNIPQP